MALAALGLGAAVAGVSKVLSRFLIPYIIFRVATAFGIVAFSIVGTTWLLDYIDTAITNNIGFLLADMSAILMKFGFGEGLGIWVSCWTVAINIAILKGRFKGVKFG